MFGFVVTIPLLSFPSVFFSCFFFTYTFAFVDGAAGVVFVAQHVDHLPLCVRSNRPCFFIDQSQAEH